MSNFIKCSLGYRIRKLRESKKLSQKELSDIIPMSQASLHRIEVGDTVKSGKLVEIAAALGTTAEYLQNGTGFVNDDLTENQVPILKWEEVKDWVVNKDKIIFFKDVDRQFIFPPQVNINSKMSFALKIDGNSMQNCSNESFNIGDVILVDPKNECESGDFIIYPSPESGNPILRKLIIEDKNYLYPLNNSYAIEKIDDISSSFGTVISKISLFRFT